MLYQTTGNCGATEKKHYPVDSAIQLLYNQPQFCFKCHFLHAPKTLKQQILSPITSLYIHYCFELVRHNQVRRLNQIPGINQNFPPEPGGVTDGDVALRYIWYCGSPVCQ